MLRSALILSAFCAIAIAKPCGGFGFGGCGGPGPRGPPPCGLPPFLEKLPADAQEKVKAIWANYKEGDKCYEQHGLTREIIDALPKDIKKSLRPDGPPLPPPLRKAPKEIQQKFEAIFKDKSISHEDKPQKLYELAQKVLTGDLLKEFTEFHEKMESHRKSYEEKKAKLTGEAKIAQEKIDNLMKQKHEIIDGLSESARTELFDLWSEKPGKGGPPHF